MSIFRALRGSPIAKAANFIKRDPGTAALTAGGGLFAVREFGVPILNPITRQIASGGSAVRRDVEAFVSNRRQELKEAAKMQRLSQAMAQNTARLAEMNDGQQFRELLANRRLPKGAVVIGGQQRPDLIEEMALRMSQGQYRQPQAEDELAALIGAQ